MNAQIDFFGALGGLAAKFVYAGIFQFFGGRGRCSAVAGLGSRVIPVVLLLGAYRLKAGCNVPKCYGA